MSTPEKIDFLNELNDSQLQAVTYFDSALLVIAGAGSGKTRVLTYKIAYLISKGISPASILALTFTNKAAKEMKTRIGQLIGFKMARYVWMGTFHSIFSKILRSEAEYLGFTKNFTIYDSSDSKSLIKAIIKELNLDEKIYKPAYIHSRISQAKNQLILPESYVKNADYHKYDTQSRVPRLGEIYGLYVMRCKTADAMDFDDLLLQTNILFNRFPEVLQKYQQIFSYILVDEYQDTNFSQYLIIKKLSEQHGRVCVVGDDAQSIYSFRGANIDNILHFQKTYQNAKIFKLEQNYRSTKNIVNAANSLIDKNSEQIKKTIFSDKNDGGKIRINSVLTDYEEGIWVGKKIEEIKKESNISYGKIAVLYRTNSQSRVMEESLRKQNIPYRIYGGLSFYQRKEIKDVIAYLRLITNSNDEEALKRIINYPARGIGDTTVKKLIDTAQLHQVSAWEVLSDILKYNLPVNAGTAGKLLKFKELIQNFTAQLGTLNAYDLANNLIKATGIIADQYDKSVENLSRIDNIQELLKAIHEYVEEKEKEEGIDFVSITDFLSEVSLLTDQDTDKDDQEERVTLMTVHAAKGLEYNTVFIVGMEEELFPSQYAETPRDLEEERRLFYVAITRAEENCLISYSKSRFKNGKTMFCNPSRFLNDIDTQYLEYETEQNSTPYSERKRSWDDDISFERNLFKRENRKPAVLFENNYSQPRKLNKINSNASESVVLPDLPVGVFVKHQLFGIGKVLETSIVDGNKRAAIDFGEKGVKSLLLQFAKLEVLE